MDQVCVLALDGADYALLKHWNCGNILLNSDHKLKTFAKGVSYPSTLEVWPTVATGVPPEEHGIILDPSENDSPVIRVLAQMVSSFPDFLTDPVHRLKRSAAGLPQTDTDHMFTDGAVRDWPGITDCRTFEYEQRLFKQLNNGNLNTSKFMRNCFSTAGMAIGYLLGQSNSDARIAGTHIHILDYAGHIFAERPEKLKSIYHSVDDLIRGLREAVDNLLILSDHGMQTTVLDDESPGNHSFRAMVSSTGLSSLPKSVYNVREWIETNTGRGGQYASSASGSKVDTPREHLEDLGYL